jgi:hypothetical protein
MKKLGFGVAVALTVALSGTALAQQKESHSHMDHVLKSWNDTPEKKGLLETSQAEAAIALQHIKLAVAKPGDLDNIKLHTAHVIHALDPSVIATGPGLGYGVKKAAAGVAGHIGFAAKAGDASDNVKLHSVHVSTSANNVVKWVDEALALAKGVDSQSTAGYALAEAKKVQSRLTRIIEGFDENKDGSISWKEGEGGLAQAKQHMGFMAQGEADS